MQQIFRSYGCGLLSPFTTPLPKDLTFCIPSEQLTDFGLSKVGLINSTDDLSGPAVSSTSLLGEDEHELSLSEQQRESRKKRSAVGTPDYLAPEILLGTGHGSYSLF